MKYSKVALAILLFLAVACTPHKPVTLYMIGDSTMANKKYLQESPERGWGMMLGQFFCAGLVVDNHAVNGRSSKSFILEGRWDSVYNKLKTGDYLVIQFGHNDQKEHSPDRYTNPYSSYRNNLSMFVKKARAKGAHPILASSIVRRNFNTDSTLIDTHGAYPFMARMVAQELQVPFVDMQSLTEDLLNELGVEESAKLFMNLKAGECTKYPEGRHDDTHLRVEGASTVAGLFVEALKKMDHPLTAYLKQ